MAKFRKGDVVTVECTVKYIVNDGDETAAVDIGYGGVTVDLSAVKLVRPKLEPGEKVTCGSQTCEFIAAHGDSVWLKSESADIGFFTTTFDKIERVESPLAALPSSSAEAA